MKNIFKCSTLRSWYFHKHNHWVKNCINCCIWFLKNKWPANIVSGGIAHSNFQNSHPSILWVSPWMVASWTINIVVNIVLVTSNQWSKTPNFWAFLWPHNAATTSIQIYIKIFIQTLLRVSFSMVEPISSSKVMKLMIMVCYKGDYQRLLHWLVSYFLLFIESLLTCT